MTTYKEIRVVRVTHNEAAICVHPIQIKHSLENMQALVGGYIECINIGKGLDLWCNEEGRINGLPMIMDPIIDDFIAGDYFFARHDNEGNTISLTDDDVRHIMSHHW